jgi:hypothetical protein
MKNKMNYLPAICALLFIVSCTDPINNGCPEAGPIDAGEDSASTEPVSDSGMCELRAPLASEQPCQKDADCPPDGPCFDFRCRPNLICEPFQFRALSECSDCGTNALCDESGMCTIPEPK